LSSNEYSIFGSQGPDHCFNQEYASLYEAQRISHLADIETATIAECHREFLRDLQVKANLVAPILTEKGLWGLLIAHHCQNTHVWSPAEIEAIKQGANQITQAELICHS
jgi:GAF domain-containing protein